MNVEVFALCEAATESMGKLNMLGSFDTIHAREIPVTQPSCALALRMRFERMESGSHRVRVNVVDGDGGSVVPPLTAGVTVQVPDGVTSQAVSLVVNFQRLTFPGFGEFAIDLAIDDRPEASLPVFVRPAPGQS